MSVQIRPPRPGDGEGMARVWLSAGAYYAELDLAHFQLPSADGLAESFEAEPGPRGPDALQLVAELDGEVGVGDGAYRAPRGRHGYRRRSILFQKPLLPGGAQGAQHVLHDAAVPVVLRLAGGVDPHDGAEFLAVGCHHDLVRHIL